MNERSVQPIASVRSPETGTYSKINASDKEEAGILRGNHSTDTNQLMQKTELRDDFAKNLSNISIHFNVDDETNHLIVVVTERKSGRVIRTIPASELEKMQAGDLLKLAA
jgi:uncharacterized FlaG/YvyC family protein